jgi:hypothetical protein
MEILQRSSHLSCIETRCVFVDTLVWPSLQRPEELASTAVFHAEIQVVFRLERVVERDNEGMVAGGQDLLFGQCTLDLVSLDHFLLAQH